MSDGLMLDTIHPNVLTLPLQDGAQALAGYLDGAVSAWPAGSFDRFDGLTVIRGTVLADDSADWFDDEFGNAPTDQIADACRRRLGRGLWSIHYARPGQQFDEAQAAHRARGVLFPEPPEHFPAPGVYWWAAEWDGIPHRNPLSLITQWTNGNDFDRSQTAPNFSTAPAPPPPPPLPGADVNTCVFDTTFDNNQQVFYVDKAGNLIHFWWDHLANRWSAPGELGTGWDAEVDLSHCPQNEFHPDQVWGGLAGAGRVQCYYDKATGKWNIQPLAPTAAPEPPPPPPGQ